MPRVVITKDVPPHKYTGVVKKLAYELVSSGSELQPLILEERIAATGSRHVHVIWDSWKNIPDEERSLVILEAYQQAGLADAAAEITIASGVTPEEAIVLGLLPWKIMPARKKNEKLPEEAYTKVLTQEAKNTLLGTKGKELRYARLEDAHEAKARLLLALPGSFWSVVQEVQTEA